MAPRHRNPLPVSMTVIHPGNPRRFRLRRVRLILRNHRRWSRSRHHRHFLPSETPRPLSRSRIRRRLSPERIGCPRAARRSRELPMAAASGSAVESVGMGSHWMSNRRPPRRAPSRSRGRLQSVDQSPVILHSRLRELCHNPGAFRFQCYARTGDGAGWLLKRCSDGPIHFRTRVGSRFFRGSQSGSDCVAYSPNDSGVGRLSP